MGQVQAGGGQTAERATIEKQTEGTMIEKLVGRLTWERKGESIRVAIPARPGAFAVIYGPVVVIWLVITSIRYAFLLSSPHPDDTNFSLQMVALGIYIVGVFYFICWLAWNFTGETIITLDPVEMNIQRRILGIELDTQGYRSHQVDRLAYARPGRSGNSQSVFDLSSSCIQFRTGNITHRFATGILPSEAHVLIEEMLKILEFQRGPSPRGTSRREPSEPVM
jgi:hypothetical protein